VLDRPLAGFVLDLDATIVLSHSEKEAAAPTWKHTFGFHPLLCFLDATGEALAGLLRPGNASSNTAADLVTVLGQALALAADLAGRGAPVTHREFPGVDHGFTRNRPVEVAWEAVLLIGDHLRAAHVSAVALA